MHLLIPAQFREARGFTRYFEKNPHVQLSYVELLLGHFGISQDAPILPQQETPTAIRAVLKSFSARFPDFTQRLVVNDHELGLGSYQADTAMRHQVSAVLYPDLLPEESHSVRGQDFQRQLSESGQKQLGYAAGLIGQFALLTELPNPTLANRAVVAAIPVVLRDLGVRFPLFLDQDERVGAEVKLGMEEVLAYVER